MVVVKTRNRALEKGVEHRDGIARGCKPSAAVVCAFVIGHVIGQSSLDSS